jgi:peptidoglycan/xylan/chitin deacetylase (PgdA/CDA1 family)
MVRQMTRRAVQALGLERLARHLHRDSLTILMYHGFVEDRAAPARGVQVSTAAFAQQLKYVRQAYSVIALPDWITAIRERKPLPPNPLVITIDDGYESTYKLAFPILRAQALPATLAVTTGFVGGGFLWNDRVEWAVLRGTPSGESVDLGLGLIPIAVADEASRRQTAEHIIDHLKRIPQARRDAAVQRVEEDFGARLSAGREVPPQCQPLTWTQLLEMVQTGLWTVANHTQDYHILAKCTPQEGAAQITSAHQVIREHTGQDCTVFCFPNGQPGDYTEETLALLSSLGYKAGLTTIQGKNARGASLWELKRFAVTGEAKLDEFPLLLHGGLHGLRDELLESARRRPRAA